MRLAAVASAFLVNALIVPVDGILIGIANDAIALVQPGKTIGLLSNQWFEMASVVLIGNTPFMSSLIVSIALIFIAAGAAYGLGAGTMTNSAEVVAAMQKAWGL